MTGTKVCIRIDIDTVRDTQVLPVVLEILDHFDAHATFFVTTGPDTTFKNYRNYLNPLKLLQKKAIQQHGMKQMFRGMVHKQQVQASENLHLIMEQGHELGLHGYSHYEWIHNLQKRTEEEITSWISKGCAHFEDACGYLPRSFASPGFTTSSEFLAALEKFKFDYSSDFRGNAAFYPQLSACRSRTLQLPVCAKSFGELEFEGYSQDEIYGIIKHGLDTAQHFFVFYMHPSYEPILNRDLLIKVLDHIISSEDLEIITMHQLSKTLKRRGLPENPANI